MNDAILQYADAHLVRRVVEDWKSLLVAHRQPDAGWKWDSKTSPSELCDITGVEHVMITHDGRVQGVMVTSAPEEPPRLSKLSDLLYVEYLATAPWNRRLTGVRQIFKKLGPVLLGIAAERSVREGRRGRIGLHSEPDPNTLGFYEQSMKLDPCGRDSEQEMREYFEGTLTPPASTGGAHGT